MTESMRAEFVPDRRGVAPCGATYGTAAGPNDGVTRCGNCGVVHPHHLVPSPGAATPQPPADTQQGDERLTAHTCPRWHRDPDGWCIDERPHLAAQPSADTKPPPADTQQGDQRQRLRQTAVAYLLGDGWTQEQIATSWAGYILIVQVRNRGLL